MKCIGCGQDIDNNSKFCTYCGQTSHPTERLCLNGHPMTSVDKFCGECGVPPETPGSLTEPGKGSDLPKDKTYLGSKKRAGALLAVVAVLLVAGVGTYFLVARQTDQVHVKGAAAHRLLAKFCNPGTETSTDYSTPVGATDAFDITCVVGTTNFIYSYYTTPKKKAREYNSLSDVVSIFPDRVMPVLSGSQWIGAVSGPKQTVNGEVTALSRAHWILGGQIEFFADIGGSVESSNALSAVALGACTQNLMSWAVQTADDALNGEANEDWVAQFGANSTLGVWIQDEVGVYARTLVNQGESIATETIQVSASQICTALNGSEQLTIPGFH